MIVELLVMLAFAISGALLLTAFGFRGWPLLPLGFTAGVATFVVLAFAHALVGTPVSAALPLVAAVAVPGAVWLYRLRSGTAVIPSPVWMVASAALLSAAVVFFWHANLVKYHFDSLRYLIAGSLFHEGHLESLSGNLLTKRFSSVSVIHSLGGYSDGFYLRSLTPLLALALLGVLSWLVFDMVRERRSRALATGTAGLGVLLLVTNYGFLWHSFYINGHLIFGAMFVVIAGVGWFVVTRPDAPAAPALVAAQCVAIGAAVMSRPEGLFLVGAAVVPMAVSSRVSAAHKVAVVSAFGASVLLYQGFIARYTVILGDHVSRDTARLMALGAGALILAGLLALPRLRALVERFQGSVLWLAEAGLWLVLAAYWLRNPEPLEKNIESTIDNVMRGTGGWGPAVVGLAVLVGVALLRRFSNDRQLRFPVTTFLPLIFVIAYLALDGGFYRAGQTGSGNRMLMHVIPLAVLYVMTSAGIGEWRWSRARRGESDRSPDAARVREAVGV